MFDAVVHTNESGEYNFPALTQGTHTITHAKAPFTVLKVSEKVEISSQASQLSPEQSLEFVGIQRLTIAA